MLCQTQSPQWIPGHVDRDTGIGHNAIASATDIFLYVYIYFIDWNIAFNRMFTLSKSFKYFC